LLAFGVGADKEGKREEEGGPVWCSPAPPPPPPPPKTTPRLSDRDRSSMACCLHSVGRRRKEKKREKVGMTGTRGGDARGLEALGRTPLLLLMPGAAGREEGKGHPAEKVCPATFLTSPLFASEEEKEGKMNFLLAFTNLTSGRACHHSDTSPRGEKKKEKKRKEKHLRTVQAFLPACFFVLLGREKGKKKKGGKEERPLGMVKLGRQCIVCPQKGEGGGKRSSVIAFIPLFEGGREGIKKEGEERGSGGNC